MTNPEIVSGISSDLSEILRKASNICVNLMNRKQEDDSLTKFLKHIKANPRELVKILVPKLRKTKGMNGGNCRNAVSDLLEDKIKAWEELAKNLKGSKISQAQDACKVKLEDSSKELLRELKMLHEEWRKTLHAANDKLIGTDGDLI